MYVPFRIRARKDQKREKETRSKDSLGKKPIHDIKSFSSRVASMVRILGISESVTRLGAAPFYWPSTVGIGLTLSHISTSHIPQHINAPHCVKIVKVFGLLALFDPLLSLSISLAVSKVASLIAYLARKRGPRSAKSLTVRTDQSVRFPVPEPVSIILFWRDADTGRRRLIEHLCLALDESCSLDSLARSQTASRPCL